MKTCISNQTITSVLLLAMLCASTVLGAPPQKGDRIPDVTVRNAENKELNLRALVSEKPTVLIFYRGGWCPFCTTHLSALIDIQDQVAASGAQILAVSIDQPSKIKETPNYESLGYTLLSDADAKASEAFGIVFTVPDELVSKYKTEYGIDLEAASGRTHHKLPHPSVFVVDPQGTVEFVYINEDYKVRLEPDKILEALKTAID
jgi:peroxiredoxin